MVVQVPRDAVASGRTAKVVARQRLFPKETSLPPLGERSQDRIRKHLRVLLELQ